ncbi:MAG TPA: serine hydrolase [Terriglobales bacterium]|nr:serine hydrolase [Terriglobales bacterium]
MKRLSLVFWIGLCALPALAQGNDLQPQLEAMIRDFHGHAAIFAKDLKTGRSVAINADEPTQTASVIKLSLMLETFAEVKQGKIKLDDPLPLLKFNQVEGSGILQFLHPGLNTTVEDNVVLMIEMSDNTATNQLIDKVPLANVNARLAAMGLKNTYFYKKVFKPSEGPQPPDQKKFGLGKTTAREMAQLMESIERCDLGAPELCQRMIDILKHQTVQEMIPRFIQSGDTSVAPASVANKTGSLDDVRNDVAIVYAKSGPIIISAFTWDNADHRWTPENSAELLIANMAKAIVVAWSAPQAQP